jgi:hypothetical protein
MANYVEIIKAAHLPPYHQKRLEKTFAELWAVLETRLDHPPRDAARRAMSKLAACLVLVCSPSTRQQLVVAEAVIRHLILEPHFLLSEQRMLDTADCIWSERAAW